MEKESEDVEIELTPDDVDFQAGLNFLYLNSPQVAKTSFESAKKNAAEPVMITLYDYLIDLCNVIVSSQNSSYVEAFENIVKAKRKVGELKEKLPPELNQIVSLCTILVEMMILQVASSQSQKNRDYDIASEKYTELVKKIGEVMEIDIPFDDSTRKYFEGLQELNYGNSKLLSAEFQSDSGLPENAINLCQEANQHFMNAVDKFSYSTHPLAESSCKQCLQISNNIIPKNISVYRLRSVKEKEYRRALSELEHYKQIIEKSMGVPSTNVSFETTNQLLQENVTIVQNMENQLKQSLGELLNLDKDNPKLSDLKNSVRPLLEKNGKSFLDSIKELRPKLETVGNFVEKTAPIFMTVAKILEYMKMIP